MKQAKHCNNIDIYFKVILKVTSTYTRTDYMLSTVGGLKIETITNSICLNDIFHKQEVLQMLSQSAIPIITI